MNIQTFLIQTTTLVLVLVGFISPKNSQAQLIVNQGMTPQQYVQNVLVGSGVVVSNVTYSGMPNQIGDFNSTNTEIFTTHQIQNGIILSSGDVSDAIGPNFSGFGSSTGVNIGVSDVDLDAISQAAGNDAVVLEFDFIPSGDSITFNYIFGSEEYMSFANSTFNDAFGFFLSGPGITGPYTNNAINIATLPNGTTPVTINNINAIVNPSFYVDNGGSNPVAPFSTDPKYIQFNGHTVPLTAGAKVSCGQTYHLKLAIQDISDGSYDSGVFIESGSLSSNAIKIDLVTATGSDSIVEGCSPATFSLIRPDTIDSLVVDIKWYGNAINGTDYTLMPDSIVFVPGSDTIKLQIDPLLDGIIDPQDTVILEVTTVNICGDTIRDSAFVYIMERPYMYTDIKDTILECPTDPYLMNVNVWGSEPPYTFAWSDASGNTWSGNPVNLDVTQNPQTYYVTIQSGCTPIQLKDTFTVTTDVPSALTGTAGTDQTLQCPGFPVIFTSSAVGGTAPYTYQWNNGAATSILTDTPSSTTTYTVTITDKCGRTITDDATVNINYVPMTLTTSNDTNFICPGPQTSNVWVIPTNGDGPYSYLWNNGTTDSLTAITTFGPQTYTVQVTDNCGATQNATVNATFSPYTPLATSITVPNSACIAEAVPVSATATNGLPGYSYNWSNGVNSWSGATSSFSLDIIGLHDITVNITDACGVSISATQPINLYVCKVASPNVFTPNNDGLNDTFIFPNLSYFPESKLTVFNRWGRKVYENTNYQNDWSAKGIKEGTYYYVLDVNNQDQETIKGAITIIK